MRYAGPYTAGGVPYPSVQLETDVGGSENLCNTGTGAGCTAPPIGAAFYPYWSLNNSQTLPGSGQGAGGCVWNFGSDIPGVTINNLGGDAQYGASNTARYGGTIISSVQSNPALQGSCGAGAS